MPAKWEIISEAIFKALEESPEGLRFSALIDRVQQKCPDQKENTIIGNIVTLLNDYPEKVYKPEKGVYRLLTFKESSNGNNSHAIADNNLAKKKEQESDFYETFAKFIVETEECTKAISLGGSKFGGKWGTPDVVGKWESRASDIIKSNTLIVAAEIKIDPYQIITAFGQACCYKLFSHKSYLVIPRSSSIDDFDKTESLCQL